MQQDCGTGLVEPIGPKLEVLPSAQKSGNGIEMGGCSFGKSNGIAWRQENQSGLYEVVYEWLYQPN